MSFFLRCVGPRLERLATLSANVRKCALGTGPLVCIVEDDDRLRVAMGSLVRSFGMEVALFADAESFLNDAGQVRGGVSSVLVTDIHLPGMSGIAMLERLEERGRAVPTIIVSAMADALPADVRFGSRTVVCVLAKPFSPERFDGCLQAAMAKLPSR